MTQTLYGGALAGLCSLSIYVPLDLLKCRAQMTKDGNLNYTNELRNVWRAQGIRGLYRGFWAFAWRDIPGWAVYFAAFEQLKIMNDSLISKMECDEQTK